MSKQLTPVRKIIIFMLAVVIVGAVCYRIYRAWHNGGNSGPGNNTIVPTPLEQNVFIHQTINLNAGNVVSAIAISTQDRTIVSGSDDSKIRLWNVNGETLGTLEQAPGSIVESLAISLDGRIMASGGTNTGKIYIWGLPSKQPLKTISRQAFNVTALAFNREVDTLASGSSQGKIKIWNLETESLKYEPLSGHGQKVTSLAISPNGTILASGSENGEIIIWDLSAGELKYNLLPKHDNKVKSLAISPDGQKLVSSSRDGKIKIWNLKTGELLHSKTGSEQEVTSVAVSPDEQTFASGSTDGKIKVWNLNTGDLLRIYDLDDYNGEFITLAIDSGGQIVVTGHVLNTIKIWLVQQKLADQ